MLASIIAAMKHRVPVFNLALVFLTYVLLTAQALRLPSITLPNLAPRDTLAPVATHKTSPPLPRDVYLIVDTDYTDESIRSAEFRRPIYGSHVSVLFNGISADGINGVDGPLRAEIISYGLQSRALLRVLDFTPPAWQRSIGLRGPAGYRRTVHRIGTTTVTNSQLLNQFTGKGIVVHALQRDDIYRIGFGEQYNGCISFAERLLEEVLEGGFRLTDFPDLWRILDDGKMYSKYVDPPFLVRIDQVTYEWSATKGRVEGMDFLTEFDVGFVEPRIVGSTRHEIWFPESVRWTDDPGNWPYHMRRWTQRSRLRRTEWDGTGNEGRRSGGC